ncbi:MAG: S41 family peptidase [Acidobacteriota bacterium]|nr:S41 family peptidase [Acidobacteriota bacterium]MDH3531075.1 S41 family peptidase [Acidobacteriota bacterium]
MRNCPVYKSSILITAFLFLLPSVAASQDLKAERVLHQNILKTVKKDVEKNYFDAKLNGVDIEKNFKEARKLIEKAKTSGEMSDIISRFLLQFNDSHVFFLPPRKTVSVDYGWELKMFDDKAFVTGIEEDSDGYKKGVRVGDQVYMIEGFIPNRRNFQLLKYHYEVLRPQPSLGIYLIKPSGNKYKMQIDAKIIKDNVFMPTSRELDMEIDKSYADNTRLSYFQEIPGLTILRMPSFGLTPTKVDKMMDKVAKDDALILDLRDNGGGLFVSLAKLLGNFFDKDVTICFVKERDGMKKYIAEPRSKKVHSGKIVVLLGNDSASAAEIFARIIQLEKRGVVFGDQSAGAVMQSKIYSHTYGLDSLIPYGVSVTIADVIMDDGQRLENAGVTPDEKIVPTALDLVNRRDPVLSKAAKHLGFEITPEEAGRAFLDR